MATNGLGLIINDDHQRFIESLLPVPVSYCVRPDVEPKWVPPLIVENQGRTNSCAGHSGALACAHSHYVKTGEVLRFSRWYVYKKAKIRGGFVNGDGGTSIGSLLDATTFDGVVLEDSYKFPGYWDGGDVPDYLDEEAQKRKHVGPLRYDCRAWETMIAAVTDKRPVLIGTPWYGNQSQVQYVETKRLASRGGFLGYHARCLVGWDTLDGELCPVEQNSHDTDYGQDGKSLIPQETWEWYREDPNFVALVFNTLEEVELTRRSWLKSVGGDVW